MFRISFVLVVLLATVDTARAQTLVGTVSDQAAMPVAGATVVVTGESGRQLAVVTDETGRFTLQWPEISTVSILVTHPGFAASRLQRALASGTTLVDVRLAMSSFAEDVRVSADLADVPEASSRLGLTKRETPASVDVVTQEAIQARGADTASTALRYVTGLTSSLRPGASAVFSSRGFTENSLGVLFNGVRVQSSTITMRNYDAFNFERVEVVRGPASVLHGEGTAAGAINFVRREAMPGRTRVEALLDTGDAHRLRVGAAATGSAGSAASYSVSFARNQFDTHVAGNHHEYNHLAGAFRAHAGRVALGVEGDWLMNEVDDAYWGTPLVDNRLDERLVGQNYNQSANNRYDDAVGWGRLTATAPLAKRLRYNGQVYGYRADRDWRNSYGFEYLTPSDEVLRRAVENLGYDHRLWGTRHDVTWDFAVGAHAGRTVVGIDLSRTDFSSPRSYGVRVPVSAVDPAAAPFAAPERLDDRRASLRQEALYGEVRFGLVERLTAVGGGRVGTLDNDIARPASGVAFSQEFSPRDGRVGLVFAATPRVSTYAQYATGSEPIEALLILGPSESGFSLAGTRLWEGGLKASLADDRVDVTAAAYDLRKRNLVTADPEDSARTIQVGRQSSRGVELAATARLRPSWLVDANVAVLKARYDAFNEAGVSRDGNLPPNVPELVVNVGTTWRPAPRVEAGLWLTRVGRRAADTSNSVFLPAYTLLDPFVRVSIDQRLDLTFRVRNATDARYLEWATRAFGVTNVYFGEPRRVILSLRARL